MRRLLAGASAVTILVGVLAFMPAAEAKEWKIFETQATPYGVICGEKKIDLDWRTDPDGGGPNAVITAKTRVMAGYLCSQGPINRWPVENEVYVNACGGVGSYNKSQWTATAAVGGWLCQPYCGTARSIHYAAMATYTAFGEYAIKVPTFWQTC